NGVTPLWLAAMNRNAAMAGVLLKAGADASVALPSGETILMTAAKTGNAALVESLIDHGAKVNDREPQFGETALMIAAAENQARVIRVLLDHQADINGRSTEMSYPKDRFGLEGVLTILAHGRWTPLMYAAREGSLEATRALCEARADIDAQDPDGTTAEL